MIFRKRFNPKTDGEICPAAWHGTPPKRQKPAQPTQGYRKIAEGSDGHTAYTSGAIDVGPNTVEMPVFYDNEIKAAGRSPILNRHDLIELAERSVSQAMGERCKPLWAKGLSLPQMCKAAGCSTRTGEKCRAAFNAALPKSTANAVVSH